MPVLPLGGLYNPIAWLNRSLLIGFPQDVEGHPVLNVARQIVAFHLGEQPPRLSPGKR